MGKCQTSAVPLEALTGDCNGGDGEYLVPGTKYTGGGGGCKHHSVGPTLVAEAARDSGRPAPGATGHMAALILRAGCVRTCVSLGCLCKSVCAVMCQLSRSCIVDYGEVKQLQTKGEATTDAMDAWCVASVIPAINVCGSFHHCDADLLATLDQQAAHISFFVHSQHS